MKVYREEEDLQFVEANGLRFAYVERGTGPLVLMMHGFPDTPHTWDHIMAPVAAAGYRVVAPYMRGYAPTGVPEKDTTIEILGQDVVALVQALGAESAILIGHDWGSAAVFSAACIAPHRVSKLVSVAIPHPASIKPGLRTAIAARHFILFKTPWGAPRFHNEDAQYLRTLYKRWSPNWNVPDDELNAIRNVFRSPGSLKAALGYYRASGLLGAPRTVRRRITADTLMVGGDSDPGMGLVDYRRAAGWHDGAYEVEILPGGHFVHRESPAEFERVLLTFLGHPA